MLIKSLQSNKIKTRFLSQHGVFTLFLILALTIWLAGANQYLFLAINKWHSVLPDSFWKAIVFVCTPKFAILPILLIIITFLKCRGKLVNVIILIIVYYAVFVLLKDMISEARPYIVLAKDSFFWLNNLENPTKSAYHSFPSGHTGNMAVFAFAVSTMFFKNHRVLKALVLVLVILAACSRICTGWHWPLDVISGGLLGYLLVKVCLTFDLWRNGKNNN